MLTQPEEQEAKNWGRGLERDSGDNYELWVLLSKCTVCPACLARAHLLPQSGMELWVARVQTVGILLKPGPPIPSNAECPHC